MTKAEDELTRTLALTAKLEGTDDKPTTNYNRVSWHSKQNSWRVKVKRGDYEFYKEFKDEHVAAWVADCVALLMNGREGAYDRDGQYCLNFPWKKDIPTCPNPDINSLIVYEWLLKQHVPVHSKPNELR